MWFLKAYSYYSIFLFFRSRHPFLNTITSFLFKLIVIPKRSQYSEIAFNQLLVQHHSSKTCLLDGYIYNQAMNIIQYNTICFYCNTRHPAHNTYKLHTNQCLRATHMYTILTTIINTDNKWRQVTTYLPSIILYEIVLVSYICTYFNLMHAI